MDISTILPSVSRFGLFLVLTLFGSFFHACITVVSLPDVDFSVFHQKFDIPSFQVLTCFFFSYWSFPILVQWYVFLPLVWFSFMLFFIFFHLFFVGCFTPIFPYTCPEFLYCWYLSFVFWSLISFLVEFSLVFLEDAVVFS